ncbi:MAG: sigma-70 family RNA polymerase sigma factor [Bryobacteraceae bacterium]
MDCTLGWIYSLRIRIHDFPQSLFTGWQHAQHTRKVLEMIEASGEITQLLHRVRKGDRQALGELWQRLHPELHRLAERYFRTERQGHTLSPTALIHEAYLELVDQSEKAWQSRAHFVGVAAQVMRRILVEYARSHRAHKRAGAHPNISLHEELVLAPERAEKVLALDEALERLAALDARQSRIVELRFFGGLSDKETAEALGIGVRTVTREWSMAKAWLYGALQPSGG